MASGFGREHTWPSVIVCREPAVPKAREGLWPHPHGVQTCPTDPSRYSLGFLAVTSGKLAPGRRAGSELECLRFLGLPGPRRAGLRELSSLLGATERMLRNLKTLHP